MLNGKPAVLKALWKSLTLVSARPVDLDAGADILQTRRTGNQLDVRNRLRKGSLKLSGEVQAAEDGLSKSLNRGTALGPIGEAMRITYGELSAMDIDGSNDNKKIRSAGRIAIKLVSEIKEAVRETMNRVRSASFDNLKKQPKPKVQKAGR